jgi:hypothetical protein
MSDVGPTPIKGTPPVGGKKPLSQDKSGISQNPDKQAQAHDKEAPKKPNFDTAVAVAPSVMGLHLRQLVEGKIEAIDTEGRPVMVTSLAKFALEPDAGLTPGHRIEIEITQLSKTIEGTLKTRDGQPVPLPIQVTLTLVNLLQNPEVSQEQLTPAETIQYTYKEGQEVNPQIVSDKAFKGDQASIALQKAITDPIISAANVLSTSTTTQTGDEQQKPTNPTKAKLSPSDMKSLVTETQNISGDGKTVSVDNVGVVSADKGIPLGAGNFFPARIISSASGTLVSGEVSGKISGKISGEVFKAVKVLGIGSPLTATIVPTIAQPENASATQSSPAPTAQLGPKGEPLLKGVFITADQASGRKTLETPINPTPALQSINTHYLKTDAGMVMITATGSIQIGTPLSFALTPTSTVTSESPGNPSRPLSMPEAKVEQVKIATEMQNQRAAEHLAKSIIKNEGAPYEKPSGAKPFGKTPAPEAVATSSTAASIPTPPSATTAPPSTTAAATSSSTKSSSNATAAPSTTQAKAPSPVSVDNPNKATKVKADLPIESDLLKALGAGKPLATITNAPLREMPQNWPVMDALQQTIAAATLAGAASVTGDPTTQLAGRTPAPNQSFANTTLFFMAALGIKEPKVWLGNKLSKTIEAVQKKDVFKALFQDFSRLSQLKSAPLQGEWRPTLIPFLNDQQIQAMVILNREEQNQKGGGGQQEKGKDDEKNLNHKRFIIAVDFSHLGKVELDGLLRPLKLDFVLRTEKNIPPAIAKDMQGSFDKAMAQSELTGSLSFEPLENSPVDIRKILNEAQAVIADQEIKI